MSLERSGKSLDVKELSGSIELSDHTALGGRLHFGEPDGVVGLHREGSGRTGSRCCILFV